MCGRCMMAVLVSWNLFFHPESLILPESAPSLSLISALPANMMGRPQSLPRARSSVDRAVDFESKGRGFKSLRARSLFPQKCPHSPRRFNSILIHSRHTVHR